MGHYRDFLRIILLRFVFHRFFSYVEWVRQCPPNTSDYPTNAEYKKTARGFPRGRFCFAPVADVSGYGQPHPIRAAIAKARLREANRAYAG